MTEAQAFGASHQPAHPFNEENEMYDILVRFPSKKIADEFCGQMSDGFGENFCDFSFHRQKEGTKGDKAEHYERITSDAPKDTPVYFVKHIFI